MEILMCVAEQAFRFTDVTTLQRRNISVQHHKSGESVEGTRMELSPDITDSQSFRAALMFRESVSVEKESVSTPGIGKGRF